MKWKIIRNQQKEIIKYELTENIYIERDYLKSFTCDTWANSLVVNGVIMLDTSIGSGYTLKDLKKMGEYYLEKSRKY